MLKDYYQILGINEDASPEAIKSAYRRLAMQLHPDHSGSDCQPFQDIQEAYSVLSDPQRRSAYDHSRGQKISLNRKRQHGYDQPPSASQAEPLIPDRPWKKRSYDYHEFADNEPGFVSPLSEFINDFFNMVGRTSFGYQGIEIEVPLSPRLARNGGTIEIDLPVSQICPRCHGFGNSGFMICRHCDGSGQIESLIPINIDFPEGIEDGASRVIPLRVIGLPNNRLILHFRIDQNR